MGTIQRLASTAALLLLASCANKGSSGVKNLNGPLASWNGFLGLLRIGAEGTCSVSYMGNLMVPPSDHEPGGRFAFALTASHCVEKLFGSEVLPLSVLWYGNGEVSQVAKIEIATGQTTLFGDVALLRMAFAPERVAPFSKELAWHEFGGGDQQFNTTVRAPAVGMKVTVVGMQATGGEPVPRRFYCSIVEASDAARGFEIGECSNGLDASNAPGLSGSLVVNPLGDPVGVFKGSLPGTVPRFAVAALAWTAETSGSFGLPNRLPPMSPDDQLPVALCSADLKVACGPQTTGEPLIACAKNWVSLKTILGTAASLTNGELCKLNPDLPEFQQKVFALSVNNNGSIGGSSSNKQTSSYGTNYSGYAPQGNSGCPAWGCQ
jgi:hypothetical protein